MKQSFPLLNHISIDQIPGVLWIRPLPLAPENSGLLAPCESWFDSTPERRAFGMPTTQEGAEQTRSERKTAGKPGIYSMLRVTLLVSLLMSLRKEEKWPVGPRIQYYLLNKVRHSREVVG